VTRHTAATLKPGGRAEIAIELCELVQLELDQVQASALEVAKRYWTGSGSEQDLVGAAENIAKRLDRLHQSTKISGRVDILDRLAFCALNRNTGLSVLAGEYLAELAEALELLVENVSKAFSRRVPNFERS
jgi:hypothetical protein